MGPIHTDMFYSDGRGPELHRVRWDSRGTRLQAIEYFNPDDVRADMSLKHVHIEGFQVVTITPEEVINYAGVGVQSEATRPAAMFDLGRSAWLRSFAPTHLSACKHFQLLFYDELFDVICARVSCRLGGYDSADGS